jgi:hypothetical protein
MRRGLDGRVWNREWTRDLKAVIKMTNEYTLGNLRIVISPDWKDITDTLDDENAPFTLAKEAGVGAFQFSTAEYRGGKHPAITMADLDDLRSSFARGQGFPDGFDEIAVEGAMMVSGGSYHAGENLMRVWYCSDGPNVVFATYVSDWNLRNGEEKEFDAFLPRFSFKK